VFVAAHAREWDRLEELTRHSRTLSGSEADELVDLYQRAATHLSVVRSAAPDPALVGRLSSLVARARGVVTASGAPAYREVALFFGRRFPAALYRTRYWWLTVGAVFVAVALALAWWVLANPDVQARLATPDQVRQLVDQNFASYYSSHPAGAFAFQVWTNNAWVAALAIASGALLGIPIPLILWANAANVGVIAGLMAAHGRLAEFFGLILPHGMLELTAVFVASGAGLRLGWTALAPGDRPRGAAVAEEGRAAVGIAMGLVAVLLVSGVIEAFVTPSGLPTWARIGVGAAAWAGFLTYVFVPGRRAALAGETGDVDAEDVGDSRPVAA
jgi:uncharacterized membrane protein SpoIIM required for sporulation